METTTCAQLPEIVESVTRDVFSTMMEAEIVVEAAREVRLDSPLSDGVVALVGIAGVWTGTGRLYCSREAACYFAGLFLQMEYSEVDRQVLDAVAEMANMIVGNLKTILEGQVGPLSLSIPTVIYGQNYVTHCSAARTWTVLPVRCGGQTLDVGFFLAPTQARPAKMPTPVH